MLDCKGKSCFDFFLTHLHVRSCWYRVRLVSLEQQHLTTPPYDRDGLRRSIVHIGVGGFHRAHLATYVDELCRAGNTDWSIVGAGVMEHDAGIAQALGSQNGCYTLIERGDSHTTIETIGSIVDFVHAWPDNAALVELIAAPTTQIVSLTVTEGGYPVDDETGLFQSESPNAAPGSAFGTIAAGLEQRRQTNAGPITILSCDNVIGNGHVTQAAVQGCAQLHGDPLMTWIAANVSFPNSMVDRITPATTDADRSWLLDTHGITDAWPVVTEPFRQWVVEDNFAADRLPFEQLDILVTKDVEPYELMKLRLLNAGHSCLAYLSALIDAQTVSDAMSEPAIADFLTHFLATEAKPALPEIVGIDLDDYIASLIHRFSNPNIADQIERLCLDGTAKFPKFLLPTVVRQLEIGGAVDASALALAGWCEYLNGVTETGASIRIARDPNLGRAIEAANASRSDPRAFLDLDLVFAPVQSAAVFEAAFVKALEGLRTDGVRSTINALLS